MGRTSPQELAGLTPTSNPKERYPRLAGRGTAGAAAPGPLAREGIPYSPVETLRVLWHGWQAPDIAMPGTNIVIREG